jgi:molecular chaperone DnaK
MPQVEVTFDLDANGILNVKAVDKATNKEQKITITASSGLSKEEIDKMQKDAELHAEEDKKKKDLIEAKNSADTLIYSTEKSLAELGDKVNADLKKEVLDKIEELKKVKDGNDIEAIKKANDAVMQSAQKIGAELYKAQQEASASAKASADKQAGQQGAGSEQKADDKKPEEGEFTEKK